MIFFGDKLIDIDSKCNGNHHMENAEQVRKQTRNIAFWVGCLYLLGFVLGLLGSKLSVTGDSSLSPTTSTMVAAGALFWMAASLGDFCHGVLMFPVLRVYSRAFAISYLGTRMIQASLVLLSTLFMLLQIPLIESELSLGMANPSHSQLLRDFCLSAQTYAYHMAMLVLAIAGILLCYGAWKSALFSKRMALWGLLGYILFLFGSITEIFGVDLHLLHTAVGGLWEISMGLVLIVYGFHRSATDS